MRLHDSLFAHLRQPVSALKLHIANCHPRASPHCRSLAKPTLQQQLQNAQRFSSNRQQRQRRSTRLNCSVPAAVSGNEEWSWKVSTAKRMLEFMGPALIIPLGDPLMSLTDTVFIGQVGLQELLIISRQCAVQRSVYSFTRGLPYQYCRPDCSQQPLRSRGLMNQLQTHDTETLLRAVDAQHLPLLPTAALVIKSWTKHQKHTSYQLYACFGCSAIHVSCSVPVLVSWLLWARQTLCSASHSMCSRHCK